MIRHTFFTSIQSLIIFPKYLIKIYIMCYMFDINMVRAPVIIRLNFNPNLLLATPTPIPDEFGEWCTKQHRTHKFDIDSFRLIFSLRLFWIWSLCQVGSPPHKYWRHRGTLPRHGASRIPARCTFTASTCLSFIELVILLWLLRKLLLNIKILNIKILKKSFSTNPSGDHFSTMLPESSTVNPSTSETAYVCPFTA